MPLLDDVCAPTAMPLSSTPGPPRVHCRSPRHYCVMHLVATYSVGRRILEWAGGLRSERRARLRDQLSTRDGINPDDRIMSPAQARAASRVRSRSHAATSRPMEPSSKVPQSIPASSMPMACTVNTGGRACSPASGRQYRRLRAVAPSVWSLYGDVIVLTCGRPLGAGMEKICQVTSALKHLSWGKDVALLTDARFSRVSTGACIGHIGPEALAGGPTGNWQGARRRCD